MQKWQCRVAPSLGELEGTHQEAWGTDDYTNPQKPCVFFGLYGFNDFFTLWRHEGRRAILWAGSDIIHFRNGYWLDNGGSIRLDYKSLAAWINETCESYVENEVEEQALREVGIISKVVPSFMGKIEDYELSYKYVDRPKLYASVSGDNFDLYKWNEVEKLARKNPDKEFHLYGNTKPWHSANYNVIVHGRVSKEQMNSEIKEMQGGIRLLEHDGFSEILAKSVLWGQWPVSIIPYPHMLTPDSIDGILDEPNLEGRQYYIRALNDYPWNSKKNV